MITVSCDDSIRTFVFNNGGKENFPFFTIGKNSYINDMKIQVNMGNEVINIHIGNYCSIAYNVTLCVLQNKSAEYCKLICRCYFTWSGGHDSLSWQSQPLILLASWLETHARRGSMSSCNIV